MENTNNSVPPHLNAPTQPVNTQPAASYSTMAIMSLILGILGLLGFGPLAGIPALIMGKMELDNIKRNQSPAYNHSLAKVGLILGIVSTALYVLLILAVIFIWIVFGGIFLMNMQHLQTASLMF